MHAMAMVSDDDDELADSIEKAFWNRSNPGVCWRCEGKQRIGSTLCPDCSVPYSRRNYLHVGHRAISLLERFSRPRRSRTSIPGRICSECGTKLPRGQSKCVLYPWCLGETLMPIKAGVAYRHSDGSYRRLVIGAFLEARAKLAEVLGSNAHADSWLRESVKDWPNRKRSMYYFCPALPTSERSYYDDATDPWAAVWLIDRVQLHLRGSGISIDFMSDELARRAGDKTTTGLRCCAFAAVKLYKLCPRAYVRTGLPKPSKRIMDPSKAALCFAERTKLEQAIMNNVHGLS